jgi:hypothetical protein
MAVAVAKQSLWRMVAGPRLLRGANRCSAASRREGQGLSPAIPREHGTAQFIFQER